MEIDRIGTPLALRSRRAKRGGEPERRGTSRNEALRDIRWSIRFITEHFWRTLSSKQLGGSDFEISTGIGRTQQSSHSGFEPESFRLSVARWLRFHIREAGGPGKLGVPREGGRAGKKECADVLWEVDSSRSEGTSFPVDGTWILLHHGHLAGFTIAFGVDLVEVNPAAQL